MDDLKGLIEKILDGCLKELKVYNDYKDKDLSFKFGLITGDYNEDFDAMCAKATTMKRKERLFERIVWMIPAGAKVHYPHNEEECDD